MKVAELVLSDFSEIFAAINLINKPFIVFIAFRNCGSDISTTKVQVRLDKCSNNIIQMHFFLFCFLEDGY